jgi:aspartyl-tRNA(Asn)/glutamyl-tRNA(Gln) amidotransferase subunit C
MPNKNITSDEVRKIAKLARLKLTDEEVERFKPQLSAILSYVGQLDEVNTDNIEPTQQVTGLINITREDMIDQFSEQEKLVNLAEETEDNYIKVKNVL